jgi:predicted RNA binding protein YcfA (HicA-like mRNA interferase family)
VKLPLLTGKQVLSTFQRMGFAEVSRKGDHVKMQDQDGKRIIFPFHPEVDCFTLKGALRDAAVDLEDFIRKIK